MAAEPARSSGLIHSLLVALRPELRAREQTPCPPVRRIAFDHPLEQAARLVELARVAKRRRVVDQLLEVIGHVQGSALNRARPEVARPGLGGCAGVSRRTQRPAVRRRSRSPVKLRARCGRPRARTAEIPTMSIRPEQAAPASDPDDGLGVTADAERAPSETLALAARHLDPSLVDVLRILGFDKEYTSAQGLLPLRRRPAAPTWTSTPARALPASATTTPTCARCCEATLAAEPRRRRADPLLGARRHARRGADASDCRPGSTRCSSRAPAPRRSTRR